VCDEGRGVGESGLGVYLDFKDAIARLGEAVIRERYGNLFDMYHEITHENAYETPMRIFPAIHYMMGGLWVDYNLMSNVPGLYVLGEANFSDHGANRLGASALMQGLADGYFVLPYTIGDYLATQKTGSRPKPEAAEFKQAEQQVNDGIRKLLSIRGQKTVTEFHKELGKILWEHCGMARNDKSLREALQLIPKLREEFWKDVNVTGESEELNQALERAGRVADYLELAELIVRDALMRDESCGCHFREEHVTPDGECQRNDEQYAYVAAWEYAGADKVPVLNKEPLVYEEVHLAQRSYK
jgi:succinate dehydrogenase / fumarate reductase flavoprotein subunit